MEDIKVVQEKTNHLFKRKEVKLKIKTQVTPSHDEARKIVAQKFSKSEQNIRIKNILGKFGSKKFIITANIYESEKDKLDTEGKSKKDVVKKQETPGQTEQKVAAQSAPVEHPAEAPPEASEEELIQKPDEPEEKAK
jgi:ribosomal protein S24E